MPSARSRRRAPRPTAPSGARTRPAKAALIESAGAAVRRSRSRRRRCATASRPGRSRSKARSCRSMTCTGRRRSCVERSSGRNGDVTTRRAADGRVLPLSGCERPIRRSLKLYDVVFVQVTEPQGQGRRAADLRVRPTVQGAALVLENKTGRILAMAGGFSYPLSQLNRATQSIRQPGSTLKPLTYLAALQEGLQPNTLVRDEPITLPPIGAAAARASRITGRRRTTTAAPAASLRCAGRSKIPRISRPRNLLDGGIDGIPSEASTGSARSRWKRRSTRTACATIRSCSAPSRCG